MVQSRKTQKRGGHNKGRIGKAISSLFGRTYQTTCSPNWCINKEDYGKSDCPNGCNKPNSGGKRLSKRKTKGGKKTGKKSRKSRRKTSTRRRR